MIVIPPTMLITFFFQKSRQYLPMAKKITVSSYKDTDTSEVTTGEALISIFEYRVFKTNDKYAPATSV